MRTPRCPGKQSSQRLNWASGGGDPHTTSGMNCREPLSHHWLRFLESLLGARGPLSCLCLPVSDPQELPRQELTCVILQRNTFLAQRSQGAHPESHSQAAANRQPGLPISGCSDLRRPAASRPGTAGAIVSDQILFLTHRSQLRRPGWPFSHLAVPTLPTQGEGNGEMHPRRKQ